MEAGTDHHVVFSYVTQRVDFDGVGPTIVTPNEVLVCPAGTAYRRHRTFHDEEVTVFVAVHPDLADQLDLRRRAGASPAVPGAAPDRLSLAAWRLAHELAHAEPATRADLEYSERAALLLAPMTSRQARAESATPTMGRTRRRHGALVDAVRGHLAHSHVERTLPLTALRS